MNHISTFIISITNHHLSSITNHPETLIHRASFSILTHSRTTANIKSIIIIHQQIILKYIEYDQSSLNIVQEYITKIHQT